MIEKVVYRSQAHENDLLDMHWFASGDQAQRFLASAELKAAMATAGVQGAPGDRRVRRDALSAVIVVNPGRRR